MIKSFIMFCDDYDNDGSCYDGCGDMNPYGLDGEDYEAWIDSLED